MSDDEFQDDDEMVEDDDEEIEEEEDFPMDDGDDEEVEEVEFEGDNLGRSTEIKRQKSFEVLSEADLQKRSNELVNNVKDILGLPNTSMATILLRHFKWNKEKLIESYPDNMEKINKEAGIRQELEKKPKSQKSKKYDCLICTEQYSGKDTFALGCGHRYCLDCWRGYLETAIKDGTNSINIKCPSPKCGTAVHDQAFEKILAGKPLLATYKRFLLKSLVSDNPMIKWCPAPGCNNSIRIERKGRREAVTCGCGFSFCFQCNDYDIGDHMPADCENVKAWLERASSESENIKWMIANTKRCPSCHKAIEKNGGCMHMTCRKDSAGCGHEFCWLCRGPWSEHGSETGGYYACNKYNASKAKDEDLKSEQIKTELEAYMFFYHRYDSHKSAMKVAAQQRQNADNKGSDILGKFSVRAQDTKFLKEATEQLLNNRRVLQWSYVYGFYLKDRETEKKLFEFLQEDLEKYTNRLSEIYETPLDKIPDYHAFMKWKEEVTNYTRVTSKFLEKFVQGVMKGLTGNSNTNS